ncbi:MAG: hypothetical protein CMH78_06720 [Nitrospinae bacterium]|jgi:hypothetical protein|nr:hypothetical protein [Nitrospinota bacterium]|tara:strand:- start:367 stop:561 length:195 start_codon:yes stop_codon:yes gene_type:complete
MPVTLYEEKKENSLNNDSAYFRMIQKQCLIYQYRVVRLKRLSFGNLQKLIKNFVCYVYIFLDAC